MEKKTQATREEEGEERPWLSKTRRFLKLIGTDERLPEVCQEMHSFSHLINDILKVERIELGRVSCRFFVKPTIVVPSILRESHICGVLFGETKHTIMIFIQNHFRTLHGGAVAAIADALACACVETVAGEQEFFLGEASISYLSAAKLHEEVVVEACIMRRGRNLVVCSVEFGIKASEKLCFTARATFYNMPPAKM